MATEVLTAPQKEALAAFKARLPADLEPLKDGGKPVLLWGVELDPKDSVAEKLLIKFLVAREWKVDAAAKMLTETIQWRKSFGADTILEEKFPPEFDKMGCMYGKDKEGHPICINFYGQMDPELIFGKEGNIDRFVRWRVQLMERGIKMLNFDKGPDQMTQIHDYNGVSMFKMNKNTKAASRTVIGLFNAHYPELMSRKFFCNIPFFLEYFYWAVSSLASARTRSKFVVVSHSNLRARLLDHIDADAVHPALLSGDYSSSADDIAAVFGGTPFQTLEVAAGTQQNASITVGEGDVVFYQLSTVTNDISFSLLFVERGRELKDVLLEPVRTSAKTGSVTAPKAGTVTAIFDNSFSLRTAKTVSYRLAKQLTSS